MAGTVKDTVKGRCIAALVAPGVQGRQVAAIKQQLEKAGARLEVVAPALGPVATADGVDVEATRSLLTVKSVLFDAVVVPGGAQSVEALRANGDARDFVDEAYKHFKALGAVDEGAELLRAAGVAQEVLDAAGGDGAPGNRLGVVVARGHDLRSFLQQFLAAVAHHRHWERAEAGRSIPEANRARGRAR
jgi:catalase